MKKVMVMRLFDWMRPKQVIQETRIKVAIGKLIFLATELIAGRDREQDILHWTEQLDILRSSRELNYPNLPDVIDAYECLFQMFMKRYEHSEDMGELCP